MSDRSTEARVARRATVQTIGCRLNSAESQLLKEHLLGRGYELVEPGQAADVGIINTCTVTREADGKCRKAIRQFIGRNPQAVVAVIGCYSQVGAAEIARIPGVDVIIGNQDKLSVLDYLAAGKSPVPVIVRERIDRRDFSLQLAGERPFDKRVNLKVQDGCSFGCSFCIIPQARGPARSRDWDNLLEEAQAAARRGIRELVLTGVNLGTYASRGNGITALVDALAAVPGIIRLRISSIEPTTVPEALLARMADPTHPLLPHLHLPLQAGSDEVLQRMRRRYTVAEYSEFVRQAAARVPGICIGTDIMAGFPGESVEAFAETCDRFLNLPLAYCHAFPFSERDGTAAVRSDWQTVAPAERQRRCAVLRQLSARKRHAFMAARCGRLARVLLEDPQDGGFPGYTEDYIRVRVADPGRDIRNQLVTVQLGGIHGDWMAARVVEFCDSPQR